MELHLIGSKKKSLKISEEVFGCEYNEPLIHQVVTAFQSAGRAGTAAQKPVRKFAAAVASHGRKKAPAARARERHAAQSGEKVA